MDNPEKETRETLAIDAVEKLKGIADEMAERHYSGHMEYIEACKIRVEIYKTILRVTID